MWICRKIYSQMGVVKKINCHQLVQCPLSQAVLLMLLHHQVYAFLITRFVTIHSGAVYISCYLATWSCISSLYYNWYKLPIQEWYKDGIRNRQKTSIRVVPFSVYTMLSSSYIASAACTIIGTNCQYKNGIRMALGTDKRHQLGLYPFLFTPCSVQANALECFCNKLVLEYITLVYLSWLCSIIAVVVMFCMNSLPALL